MNISKVNEHYAVSAQIDASDIAAIAAAGFVAVICNRPDNEDPGQPTATEIANECKKAELEFHHIPVTGMPIAEESVLQQRKIIDDCSGPVLAYCRSGQRSFVIWQASA